RAMVSPFVQIKSRIGNEESPEPAQVAEGVHRWCRFKEGSMRKVFVLGRAIFGGYFVYSGLHHFREQQQMSGYAASKGVPKAELAVPATGALLLAGGLSGSAGVKPREGLAALVAFLVPVTLQMHRFWEVDDPGQRMNE